MTEREQAILWLSSFVKNKEPMTLIPKQLIRLMYDVLKEQEVKTGYWIDSAGNDKCSNCGAEYSDLYPDYGNTHFCPNCGAKMEGR